MLRIIKDSKPIFGWIVLAGIIIFLSILLGVLCPELVERLTNQIYAYWNDGTPIEWKNFLTLCLILGVAYLLTALLSVGSVTIMNHSVTRHFTASLRERISDKISRLPLSYLDKTPSGEIISRIDSDVGDLGGTIHSLYEVMIEGFFKLALIVVILFFKNVQLALIIVIVVPISLFVSMQVSKFSEKKLIAFRERRGKMTAFVEEDFTGFATVKAFHVEDRQNEKMEKHSKEVAKKEAQGYFLGSMVQPAVMFMNHGVFIGICLVGGLLVVKGVLSVGTVVAFLLYARMFEAPLYSIAGGFSMMQNTVAAAKRVYGFLDESEMEECERETLSIKGDVEFENVCFSYVPEKPLIKNLNLSVKAGQKVAIVGPTGGGKTTIVNLLMRFYDYDTGSIRIDGREIKSMNRSSLRSLFGMVLQDTWLFQGTIFENIAYGKEGATREEVMYAAKRAHIDSFVESLPNGYDTMISEDSTNISGGQKQLLTIARAYLADRPMLILDEATSSVDTRTELLIQRTMDELMEERTSFVIAHRLSTIVDADIILVVRDGQIVEQGTHRELMEKNGFYTKLYTSQYAV